MRNLALILSTAALGLSSAAFAQAAPAPNRAPKPDMTRAAAQARAEAMFARMDANKDGILNETDRAAAKTQMFDRLDADRNGAISQAELAARSDAQKNERRAAMFARVDTDRNGSLSRAELEAMHAARGDRMKPGMKHGMHQGAPGTDQAMMGGHRMGAGAAMRAGPGGHRGMMKMDGPTTRQAFVDRALANFDRADTNRDGTVTQAERRAAHETMRQQWKAEGAARQKG